MTTNKPAWLDQVAVLESDELSAATKALEAELGKKAEINDPRPIGPAMAAVIKSMEID